MLTQSQVDDTDVFSVLLSQKLFSFLFSPILPYIPFICHPLCSDYILNDFFSPSVMS